MLMMRKGIKISCGLQFTIFGGYVVIINSNWIFFNLDLGINIEHCKMKVKMKIYFISCIGLCLCTLWCNWIYFVVNYVFFSAKIDQTMKKEWEIKQQNSSQHDERILADMWVYNNKQKELLYSLTHKTVSVK